MFSKAFSWNVCVCVCVCVCDETIKLTLSQDMENSTNMKTCQRIPNSLFLIKICSQIQFLIKDSFSGVHIINEPR